MIKNRLKVLRAERDWTQADLSEKVGISRQAVISIEKYKYTMMQVEVNGTYNETEIHVSNYDYNLICKGQKRTERIIGTYEIPAQKSVSKPDIINI